MDNVMDTSLDMMLVAALHWIFGLAAILMLLLQVSELTYLPLSIRILMHAVTVVDCSLLFIMGAGLLTMKRMWIDAVIVVSALSIVAFYLVPLRPAVPLEALVIIYMIYKRGEFPLKRLKYVIPIVMLTFSCATDITTNAEYLAPPGKLVHRYDLEGDKGYFNATICLYNGQDLFPKVDYYHLEMSIRCIERKFNTIMVNACGSIPETQATYWEPESRSGSVFSVGFGVVTLIFGSPEIVTIHHGENYSYLCWIESVLTPKYDEEFLAYFRVPQGMNFTYGLTVELKLEDKVFRTLWSDTLTFTS